MKGMAARGKQPELVIVREFTQTNSTIKWFLQPDDFFVVENGQSIYQGLFEAGIVQTKELLKLPLKGMRVRALRVPIGVIDGCRWPPQEESDEQMKQTGNEDDSS